MIISSQKPNSNFFGAETAFLKASRGFALVATLSITVLCVLLVIGLLGISSMARRTSSQDAAMAQAQANATMAMTLALGELQSQLGPDRRINTQADIDGATLPGQRNWLAVYDSWNASELNRPDPANSFRRFLVSGNRTTLADRDAAKTALTGPTIKLVSQGTLGNPSANGEVTAGLVPVLGTNNFQIGQQAWWIGDENSKAKINAGQDVPSEVSDLLLAQQAAQSAPGVGFPLVGALSALTGTGRATWELGDGLRSRVPTFASMGMLPGVVANTLGTHFHDISTSSRGLLTDVRNGGLKRDLSFYLQQEMTIDFRNRLRQPLYSVPSGGAQVNFSPDSEIKSDWNQLSQTTGITMEELWLFYNLPQQVLYNRPASGNAKVGVIPSGYPTLVSANSWQDVVRDPFYPYKREIYSQVKYFISLAAVPNTTAAGAGKFDLRLSVDPIVVLWNPHNVAMEYQTGGFTTVAFSSLPYEITFQVTNSAGATTTTTPLHFDTFFADVNGIEAQTGKAHKIILRPGESRVLSAPSDKAFAGRAGQVNVESGWEHTTGALFDSPTFPKALASGDKVQVTLQPRVQNAFSDYISYWFGARKPDPAFQSGTITLQNDMLIGTDLPTVVTPAAYLVNNIVAEKKIPMMLFSYYLRPERDTPTPSKSWVWNNPTINYRWPADGSLASKLHRQFEMLVVGVDAPENPYLQITPDNQAYWGGGVRADFGTPFFTYRNIPLTPPLSLAALQHSCANGFRRHWKDSPVATKGGIFPTDAFALDGHQYLAPMVSKAIGNSFAQPLIRGDRVDGSLSAFLGPKNGGTAANYNIADHSYLANAALWDSWYFSSLAPQTTESYGSNKRAFQKVFDDFFPVTAGAKPVPLPSARMLPYRGNNEAELRALVSGGKPAAEAHRKLAAHLLVDGAFNINSTSVTAWKAILGSLRGHKTSRRDRTANNASTVASSSGQTPVNGLIIANGPLAQPSGDPAEPDQWTGFRSLSDTEIDKLATSLVEEIRLRGPFLSLSDFVNRRPGNDTNLARQGTLQAAIEKAEINGPLDKGSRALGSIAGAPFPGAGEGSKATGIAGFITQADLLTPLGPALQARSDTFTIRAYGSTTDRNGKVMARAWCEATVQRVPEYLDSVADQPETRAAELASDVNRAFGRQFKIVSFRWLNSEEI